MELIALSILISAVVSAIAVFAYDRWQTRKDRKRRFLIHVSEICEREER